MKLQTNKLGSHAIAIGIFIALVILYFAPSIFENKTIPQGDVIKHIGMSEEVREYAKSDESKEFSVIGWTGSMFSGMPTYTVSTQKAPTNFLDYLETPIKALDRHGASMVLLSLICFYILLCVMGANFWLALAGSIAFAFASYNIIIIEAGHINKAYVIAYMPLTIAGMLLVFKEKWLWGGLLTTIGIALSLKNNHVQITYYLAILCFVIYIGYLFTQLKKKDYKPIIKSAGLFIASVVIGVLPNLGGLYANYELSKESIRGKSELTEVTTGDSNKQSSGLDIDYAFAWSYSKAETMTLLIPNFYGGASGGELNQDSELYKTMKANRMQVGKTIQTATYWGDQPFTSGPVYFGAIVCFLFVLGMFVIKNPMKWWIFGATVFFIILSWGRHLMPVNEFLFHYLPFYNKFRVPSMSLVIPGLTFPIIGIWGLKVILAQEIDKKKILKYLYYSLGIVGGLCLTFCLVPNLFLNFESVNDVQHQFPDWYYDALLKDRASLLKKDALRSLILIVLSGGLIYWFIKSKEAVKTAKYVAIGITLLTFLDLWLVDKRYVDYDSFVPQKSTNAFKIKPVDKFILEDKDPSYRVLNLNDPFNETYTSYYHKSIGGYNAVKLRRYQELIDHNLRQEIGEIINAFQHVKTLEDLENMEVLKQTKVLNMLNMRYIIFDKEQIPIKNTNAYGNAWFVSDVKIVDNADEEIASLNNINVLETAVIDKKFANEVANYSVQTTHSEDDFIEMVNYEPVKTTYKTKTSTDRIAIFSEIYYLYGWEAYIDGKLVPHFRADWTLRGMIVPAGEHTIEFKFIPRTYIATAKVGSAISLIIILSLIFTIGFTFWRTKKKQEKAV